MERVEVIAESLRTGRNLSDIPPESRIDRLAVNMTVDRYAIIDDDYKYSIKDEIIVTSEVKKARTCK